MMVTIVIDNATRARIEAAYNDYADRARELSESADADEPRRHYVAGIMAGMCAFARRSGHTIDHAMGPRSPYVLTRIPEQEDGGASAGTSTPTSAADGTPDRPHPAPQRGKDDMDIDAAPDTLYCRDCGEAFPFGPDERAWYVEKGFVNVPRRCPRCRAAARAERGGPDAPAAAPRATTATPCAACGRVAYVPFVPRLDKPVYCSACFERVRAARATAAGQSS